MLYAVLAYHTESEVMSWTSEQDATLMNNLFGAHERIKSKAGLGPTARLGESGRALTLRNGTVIDGPFAETKEQLLGFYMLDCANEDAALDAARELQRVNPSAVYEIRAIRRYIPGASLPEM
jgi:hypothetical protein